MTTTTTKPGRGGARPGAGRKPGSTGPRRPPEALATARNVVLYPHEWAALAAAAPDGSATKEAARRLRASLTQG